MALASYLFKAWFGDLLYNVLLVYNKPRILVLISIFWTFICILNPVFLQPKEEEVVVVIGV